MRKKEPLALQPKNATDATLLKFRYPVTSQSNHMQADMGYVNTSHVNELVYAIGSNRYQSLRPRLPKLSTSGCTTRMCRVKASLREKVFSSRQYGHLTFCLRLLCIVSSCLVKSYGRENIVLHGLPVDGLIRVHL